jgi:hypothetical protein
MLDDLQGYINENTYRFNRSFIKRNNLDKLLKSMVSTPPQTYKAIIS